MCVFVCIFIYEVSKYTRTQQDIIHTHREVKKINLKRSQNVLKHNNGQKALQFMHTYTCKHTYVHTQRGEAPDLKRILTRSHTTTRSTLRKVYITCTHVHIYALRIYTCR